MKKLLSLLLILCLMLSLALPAAAADTRRAEITYRGIKLCLDGRELTPLDEQGGSTEPFIMADRTYLPLRAIAGALALGVEWQSETNTVALTSGGELSITRLEPAASHKTLTASLTYRDISVTLDGKAVELGDSEPFIMNGSTYLPLRAIGEALGLTVKWEGAASSVHLFSPEAYHQRVTETLALDREGEAVLETCDTVTYTYPGFELVSVRPGSGADQTDSVTYFDAEGRPVKAMHYGADGSVYAEESWVYEDGLLRRHVYDAAEGSGNDSCTLYEYKNGRLSREKRFDGDTVPRVHSTDSSYTYDENGNTVKLYVHYPPGSWDEYLYEYDGSGLLLREDFTAYDILGGGFSYRSTEYFYENGLLVRSETSAGTVTEYFYEGERPVKSISALYSGEYLITTYSRA